MTCKACEIEAEIGTEEVPHPVDPRLHTCAPLDGRRRWEAARAALRLMRALLEDDEEILLTARVPPHGP